jgi:hypothetical protein
MPDEAVGSSWEYFLRTLSNAGFKPGDLVLIERAF